MYMASNVMSLSIHQCVRYPNTQKQKIVIKHAMSSISITFPCHQCPQIPCHHTFLSCYLQMTTIWVICLIRCPNADIKRPLCHQLDLCHSCIIINDKTIFINTYLKLKARVVACVLIASIGLCNA